MRTEEEAREAAILVSHSFPRRTVRVYRLPNGNHWVRLEKEISTEVEGINLTHVATYLNGKGATA